MLELELDIDEDGEARLVEGRGILGDGDGRMKGKGEKGEG